MVEVKNLFAGYGGDDVLKGVNFKAEWGECFCILGPNGCGKSTLLRSMARVMEYRGMVSLDGRDISSFSRKELAKNIALLGQSASLYFPYTVYDTAVMGRYAYSQGWFSGPGKNSREAADRVLAALELDGVRDTLISRLSGGVLQRVFLARALVQDPQVILLDEPTNHLDLKYQAGLLEYLSSWAAGGKAVIAVLHDLNLARRYAKTALVMSEGRITACGPADQVFSGSALAEAYGMDVCRFMRESLELWK
jgi:iron complex transport system ATP-binding protein